MIPHKNGLIHGIKILTNPAYSYNSIGHPSREFLILPRGKSYQS